MTEPINKRLQRTTTTLLISAVVLPVSVIACAVAYQQEDPFLAVVWMTTILPAFCLVVGVLLIRDTLSAVMKRGSWRQVIGPVVLFAPTILLMVVMGTPRFMEHKLFALRRVEFELPPSPWVFVERFQVCPQESDCKPRLPVTATKDFRMDTVPEGCCSLYVINGRAGQHLVDAFHVFLNGKEMVVSGEGTIRLDPAQFSHENRVSVQLRGPVDSYIYVVMFAKPNKSPSA